MTGAELLKSVKSIGINANPDDSDIEQFYVAANQAIIEINQIIPRTEIAHIYHFPIKPVAGKKGITVCNPNRDTIYQAENAVALAFEASGNGNAILTDSNGETLHTWSFATGGVFRSYSFAAGMHRDLILRFYGDKKYLIRDVAIYDQLKDDIQPAVVNTYGDYTEYDMRSPILGGDSFSGFTRTPIRCGDNCGFDRQILYIQGSRVFINNNYEGDYSVEYRHLPDRLTYDNMEDDVDIDAELQPLLSCRTAYYMYIVTDPDVARPYGQEYQRLMGEAKRIIKHGNPEGFRNVRGW